MLSIKTDSQHSLVNVLTIDLEDYWSVFYRDWLDRDLEPTEAVLRNTRWLLKTLEEFGVRATFFVLGEVAQKFPGLVREISSAGHEIANHGILHKQIFKLTEKQFCDEIRDSRKLLEDIISRPVTGYRAPAFSIMPETKWALEILAEQGFQYDSSIFPIASRRYGWAGFSKKICRVVLPSGKSIFELPLSTVRILGKDIPVGGGGYLRHFPYAVTRWALRRIQRERSFVVYMHPYEIDVEERQFEVEHLSDEAREAAIKHHRMQLRNRGTMKWKILRLLREFEFAPAREIIKSSDMDSYCI